MQDLAAPKEGTTSPPLFYVVHRPNYNPIRAILLLDRMFLQEGLHQQRDSIRFVFKQIVPGPIK